MEVLTLVEAIGALASTGLSVARTIAQLVDDLKEANSQIAMIGIDTKAVAFVLERLKSRLHEFPQGLSDAYREVVDVATDVESVCRKEIEEIERTIKPLMPAPGAKSLTLSQKRKWLFAKSGVASRRASLDTLKLTLNLLLAGIDIKGYYGPPPLYLKERVTQLVEETKNTETKLKIAEKTDKEARKRSKRSDTHNRAVTPLAKSKPSNTAAVLEKHKTNGVTTDHASLTEQSNAPKDRRPRVIVVSEGRSTGDSASLSSARTLSEDETELSQDEASSSDDCQMNAVAPWMPGEHWQSKIKEQLRVQKEVVKFADTALVPYHNPNSNPFAPGAAGQGNGSYPGGPWPSYSQPYPYQQHMQSYDPYYSYLPPPPPPETEPLPSAPKLSIRKKTEDPEVLKMREQLELLQLERKKAEEAQERAEMEQRIRQELETMRVAQEEARKEIELARAAAEAAAMARLEEVRKAEDERRRREAELKGQAAREERERMEAERQAEALRKYEQEALLQKAGMEARDLARETILLGYGTKAKDEEIKSLSSQLKDALSKASLSEARMWEERDSWMKERYALKEEALKARTDVMNEVRGTLSYGTWIALRPQGSGPTGPFARPPPPPGFSIPVPIRPTADRTSKPRAGSVSTVTVSSLATGSSVISLGRFWRLKYAFKRRMRKLLRMKVEEDD